MKFKAVILLVLVSIAFTKDIPTLEILRNRLQNNEYNS